MRIKKIRFVFVGIISGILYWLLEAFLHTYIFDLEGNFIENLIFLQPNELWMRITFFSFLILISIYTQRVANKSTKEASYNERQGLYYLLDELPAFVFLQANDYTIHYANDYFQKIFGKINSKKCYEILNNRKQPCDKCPLSNIFVDRVPIEREWKSSSGRTYQIYYYPFEDIHDEILVLALGIDITERKEAENLIKKKEHELGERVKELTSLYNVSKLAQGTEILLNEFFRNILEVIPPGWQYPEITGARIIFNDQEFKTKNFIETKWTQNSNITELGKLVGKVEVSYLGEKPEFDEGPFLKEERNLINALSEIIGRTIEHRNIEEDLKESEEKFRSIAEQSFIGIIVYQDGVVRYANESMSKINEYSVQEMMNLTSSEFFNIIHPDDRDVAYERVKQLEMEDNEVPPYYSYRLITKSGKLKWVNVYSKFIHFKNKEALLTTIIDDTEKIKAELMIKEEITKLKELDQIKNDLIRRISHELKTPLTSILSSANLLLDSFKEEMGTKILDFVEIINEGGLRLKNLVDNLIKIYELESNQVILKRQTQNLVDIIKHCIIKVRPLIKKRKHSLKVELPKEFYLNIDGSLIKQVIINLLTNSIKFTPPKGEIFIKLSEYDNWVEILIKDSGIGFLVEEKEKLFTKFGKIERYGQGMDVDTEGPGFGLFISKKFIQLHKGEIFMKSEGRNKGSTFIIQLNSHIN